MVYDLTNPPAFGFETKHCNAEQRYLEDSAKLKELNPAKEKSVTEEESKPRYKSQNVLKILGYFPIVGSVIGLVRIQVTIAQGWWLPKKGLSPLTNRCRHITRCVLETASCGFLLIVPDIIVTVLRAFTKKPMS